MTSRYKFIRRRKPLRRRKWVNRVSKRRRSRMQIYRDRRKEFLGRNPWCKWGLMQKPPRRLLATEVHHSRGRAGSLFLDERFWIAVSSEAHDWIHSHIAEARAMGLLCAKGEWNKPEPISPGSEPRTDRGGDKEQSVPSPLALEPGLGLPAVGQREKKSHT